MKKLKIASIILARSGSKGLKNKNILKLNGKPLLYYAIEAAKSSKKYIEFLFQLIVLKYQKSLNFMVPRFLF